MSRVMLVGLAKKDAQHFEKVFKTVNINCETVASIDAALTRITADPPALVVAEKPERMESLYGLQSALKTNAPTTPFIVTLPEASSDIATEAMRAGAFDCLARPYGRLPILAASKRATLRQGRTLFVAKVLPRKNPSLTVVSSFLIVGMVVTGITSWRNGPPPSTLSLGTAHLSGLQWEGRSLWSGDWFESTITHYEAKKGYTRQARSIQSDKIFRMADGQPILVCNTPEALVTIGSDLKIRSHQRAVGLPTLQTAASPATNPTGLAFDGENLWTSDSGTNLIYKHGPDFRVMDTVPSIVPKVQGIAWDKGTLWVIGGAPLKLAGLQKFGGAYVWRGPYPITNMLLEGMTPSGMAVGFGRLWLIGGGDPKAVSRPLSMITREPTLWMTKKPAAPPVKKEKK